MNVSLCLDKGLLLKEKKYASEQGKSLNTVIKESLGLLLKQKCRVTKPDSKIFYRWTETLAKKKWFSHLKEADVVRLVRESRRV